MTTQIVSPKKLDSEALSLVSVSLWQITRRRLMRRKSSVVGMAMEKAVVSS